MRQTATLKSLSGSFGTSVKIILTLLFLNFFTQNISAQIVKIDGNAQSTVTEWTQAGIDHQADVFNAGLTDDIFAGNEKDFFFASDWFWKLGGAKDKNDIANGAAAILPQGNVLKSDGTPATGGPFLVFAGDRISNSGDAEIGFWFFQDGTAPIIAAGDVHTFAPEKHTPPQRGDILVLADFTGGGNNASVTVLEWVGTGGTYGNSNNVFNQITNVQAAVAENNGGTTQVPGGWVFEDKGTHSTTTYDKNEFYEGYVALGTLFGQVPICFSRYMLETRASQSITAVLDDFVGGPLGGVPTCNITGNNTICQGGSTCFTSAPNTSYLWTGPQGSGYTATTQVACNISVAGTYTLVVTNSTGCTTGCSRTLTVNQPLTCNVTGNNSICAGGSTSFTATAGGGSYLWSGPGSFTGQGTNVISNLTAAGTYNVTITSTAGCTSTCNRTLTVNQPLNCVVTGNNSICSGGSTSFTATAGGSSYVWSGPGTFTGQGTNVISNVTAAGTYNVTITTSAGCISTCERTLIVNLPLTCNVTGNNSICAGGSTSFTATAGGSSYVWSGPGTFTGQGTNVISNVTAAGTYNVTITTSAGCVSTCNRTLTVNQPLTCNVTGNNSICAGGSTSFTATAGGSSYLWSGPGSFTGQGTNVISNVTAAGTYNVTITSSAGCTSTCERTLTVNQPLNCGVTGNNTVCQGGSTSFTATAGGSSYLWSGPGTFTGQGTNVISNVTAAGTYNVTITTSAGCTSTCNRVLTVNNTPPCEVTGNNSICAGGSTSFTATAGGTSYLWSGPGSFNGQGTNVISNVTAAGTYNVTITSSGGCTSTCQRTLTVNQPISCNVTGTNTICAGGSASFTATAGGSSYLWSGPGSFTGQGTNVISNVTAAGTYNVTITTSAGCTSTCNRTLTVNQPPTVSAGTDPLAQCRAASVTNGSLVFGTNTFSVTGSNLTNAVLAVPAWSVAPGGNPNGYTVNIVSPNSLTTNVEISGAAINGGSVRLLITANSNATPSCGTATDDVVLTLNPRPLVKALVGSDFCPNVTSTGSVALFNSENGVSYQLNGDALIQPDPIQAPKLGNGGTLLWTGLGDGSYTVIGTFLATSCNTTSGPADVVEDAVPDVHITPFAAECNTDPPVTLLANLTGGTFSGTGVLNGIFNPSGLAPGTYTITYNFLSQFGCPAVAQFSATVVSCASQICTYTQGYFGNPGGLSSDGTHCGLTTTQLINQSLGNWPGTYIRIGYGSNYVQINDADAACIITVMPGGGPAAEVTGANQICSLPAAMLKNGRIHNVLLAQTIALGLNIGITSPSTLGDFVLKAGTLYTAKPVGGCGSNVPKARKCNYDANGLLIGVENEYNKTTFSQALIDAIAAAGYPKTVGGLFSLANDAIGNKDGVVGTERGISLSEIGGAAGSINEVFDECAISVGWDIGPCPPSNIVAPPRITVSASAEAATIGQLKVSAFPNPYRNDVKFVIESPVAGQATLEVYNIAGQKIQTLFNGHIDANETRTIDFKPAVANGMMIYTLRIGNRQVTGKLIGLKQ